MSNYTILFQNYIRNSNEKLAVKDELTSVLGQKKYNNLLDIGCGTGEILEPVIDRFETITALDKECRLANNLLHNSKIEFIKQDFLSYQTKIKFDVILAAYVLWEIPFSQWDDFFTKINAMLKPEGKLLVIDKCPDEDYDNSFFEFNTGLFQDDGYPNWNTYLKEKKFNVQRHFFTSSITAPSSDQMYEILKFFFQSPEKKRFYDDNRNRIISDLKAKTDDEACTINFKHSLDVFTFNP